jgi:hypothetical protein
MTLGSGGELALNGTGVQGGWMYPLGIYASLGGDEYGSLSQSGLTIGAGGDPSYGVSISSDSTAAYFSYLVKEMKILVFNFLT